MFWQLWSFSLVVAGWADGHCCLSGSRKRISVSCERLRALLPQFDGRREDMASVLEMAVQFLRLAGTLVPSQEPHAVSAVPAPGPRSAEEPLWGILHPLHPRCPLCCFSGLGSATRLSLSDPCRAARDDPQPAFPACVWFVTLASILGSWSFQGDVARVAEGRYPAGLSVSERSRATRRRHRSLWPECVSVPWVAGEPTGAADTDGSGLPLCLCVT